MAELQETWPVKLRVTGPETEVFSGLTRQDASAVFPFATTGQRHAFEDLGAAAAWQVDFTARENQVVPGTLADDWGAVLQNAIQKPGSISSLLSDFLKKAAKEF